MCRAVEFFKTYEEECDEECETSLEDTMDRIREDEGYELQDYISALVTETKKDHVPCSDSERAAAIGAWREAYP